MKQGNEVFVCYLKVCKKAVICMWSLNNQVYFTTAMRVRLRIQNAVLICS